MRRPCSLGFATLALVLGACSSEPADNPSDEGPLGGRGGASGAIGGAPTCADGPGPQDTPQSQSVERVTALLLDENGDPLPEHFVQLCGIDVCVDGMSNADGQVSMGSAEPIKKPALKVGDGRVYAKVAQLLPPERDVDLGVVRAIRLPSPGEGAPIAAGASASSAGLTVAPASGSSVRFDGITFRTPEERQLRALRLDGEAGASIAETELGFELIYAAGPPDTRFCPPALVAIENTEGWAPGEAVEVWLRGDDITEEWAPYGGWAKVSDARVSDDGARIETTEPGLPVLGLLAFKRRE